MLGVPWGRLGQLVLWYAPALPACGAEKYGDVTGREGLVPAELWLLRACARAQGGVGEVREKVRHALYKQEEQWDADYMRTVEGVLVRDLRPCPPFAAPAPSARVWRRLCEQVPAEERTRTGIEELARMVWDAQESVGMTWTGTTYHITGAAHERWMEMARGHLMRYEWRARDGRVGRMQASRRRASQRPVIGMGGRGAITLARIA